jgi:hypothetical protein
MEDAYFRLSRFSCPSPQQAAGYSNKINSKNDKLKISDLVGYSPQINGHDRFKLRA